MTLFDIFYQHTEWWCNPDLGHDTQGKYGDVLKEMEDCALDYARSIKDTGDRWKRVIENETRELCLPNHYSWNLRGDKKEWHDRVVRDFLVRIRKAIEHCYGYNFTELPKSILPSYGIYCDEWPTKRKPQQKHIEAPQQPIGGNSGELAGNDNENAPEGNKYHFPLWDDLKDSDKKLFNCQYDYNILIELCKKNQPTPKEVAEYYIDTIHNIDFDNNWGGKKRLHNLFKEWGVVKVQYEQFNRVLNEEMRA